MDPEWLFSPDANNLGRSKFSSNPLVKFIHSNFCDTDYTYSYGLSEVSREKSISYQFHVTAASLDNCGELWRIENYFARNMIIPINIHTQLQFQHFLLFWLAHLLYILPVLIFLLVQRLNHR